jgi:opacity protein-like surface antigen
MLRKIRIILLLFTISFTSFSQSSKLEKGKESLKNSSISSTSTKKSKRTKRKSRNTNSFVEVIFVDVLLGVFEHVIPGVLFGFPGEREGEMYSAKIAKYPYQNLKQGNFVYTDSTNFTATRFDFTNNFVIENNNLYGTNLGVNFRFLKRWALDVDYLYLTEKNNRMRDSFSLYSTLLKNYRIRSPMFDAWVGLGIMHVKSDVNKSGLGVGFGAEAFIVKPISLEFSYKKGFINENTILKTKVLAKYHLKNYHISSGYEHFKIGVSKINTFSFGIGVSL